MATSLSSPPRFQRKRNGVPLPDTPKTAVNGVVATPTLVVKGVEPVTPSKKADDVKLIPVVNKAQQVKPVAPSKNANNVTPAPVLPHVEEFARNVKFDYRAVDDLPATHGHLQHVALRERRNKLSLMVKPHQPLRLRWVNEELPMHYSLRDRITRVLNQGNLGACVAHSMAQALNILSQTAALSMPIQPTVVPAESSSTVATVSGSKWGWNPFMWFRSKEVLPATKLQYNGIGFDGSRLFIYDSGRTEDGTSLDDDAGCSNFSACLGVAEWGVCEEKLWPYEEANYRTKPPGHVYEAAKKRNNLKYSVVDRTFDAVCAAIASNHPVMIGVMVYPSLIHSGIDGGKGHIPLPHHGERLIGGHSLLAVGYDRITKTITCVNHWGESWGDRGFCTLPADYIEDNLLAVDFVAVEDFDASY